MKTLHLPFLLSRICMGLFAAGISLNALADMMSPVGAWNTIDDETQKPKSVVRIMEKDGVVSGAVEKLSLIHI